jgi:hypothetical protein
VKNLGPHFPLLSRQRERPSKIKQKSLLSVVA